MTYDELITLINAFRAETQQDAITPDSLGQLLKKMVDYVQERNIDSSLEEALEEISAALETATDDISDAEQDALSAILAAISGLSLAYNTIEEDKIQLKDGDDNLLMPKTTADIVDYRKDVMFGTIKGVYVGLRNANAVIGTTFSTTAESTTSKYRCGYIDVNEGDILDVTLYVSTYYNTCVLVDSSGVVKWASGTGDSQNQKIVVGSGMVRLYFNYHYEHTYEINLVHSSSILFDELFPTKLVRITPKFWTPANTNQTYTYDGETLNVHVNTTNAAGFATSDVCTNGKPWRVKFSARMVSGASQTIAVGYASSNESIASPFITISGSDWVDFDVRGNNSGSLVYNFAITVPKSKATAGREFEIKNIRFYNDDISIPVDATQRIKALEASKNNIFSFNTDAFLQGCDRHSKYLVKIACCGDSLTANAIGGDIPSDIDEGNDKVRPMRLLTNGVPRRLYDLISWNKPTWRRLDHSDWTKSGFTSQSYSLFKGINPGYWKSTSANSYAEITVPSGMEHFALICRQLSGGGTLNVTINGSAPGTYPNPYYTDTVAGNSVVTTDVVPETLPIGAATIDLTGTTTNGNFYHIVQFNNLPSGQANTIRFTTASSAQCDIWGGFYWSGNTAVVMNLGHGGYTTSDLLDGWMAEEVYNEDYDSILFEVTEMNNLRLSLGKTVSDLQSIIGQFRTMNVDHCFTSCNPLGLSIVHDTNFYATYTNPSQKMVNDTVRELMAQEGEPFVDLFQFFTWHIERRGGSLTGGEGGLWYTWDGQHGNEDGVKLWFDALKKVIANKTIMID